MGVYTPQAVDDDGAVESLTAVAASDTFTWPTGATHVWLSVNNADASPNTVTVVSQATASDGLAKANKSVVVAAGTRQNIRISQAFRDANGSVTVQHSNTTGNTAGVFHLA